MSATIQGSGRVLARVADRGLVEATDRHQDNRRKQQRRGDRYPGHAGHRTAGRRRCACARAWASLWSLPGKNQVGGTWGALVPGAGVAQSRKVCSFEESFTRAKQDRRDSDVHLVDQALAKILLNDMDCATDAAILACSRFARLRQGGGNTFGNEVQACSAFHDQRRPGMVCQHEHRHVIDRIFAPPTPPTLIWPGSANRPEHVAAENPGPDRQSSGGDTGCSACARHRHGVASANITAVIDGARWVRRTWPKAESHRCEIAASWVLRSSPRRSAERTKRRQTSSTGSRS